MISNHHMLNMIPGLTFSVFPESCYLCLGFKWLSRGCTILIHSLTTARLAGQTTGEKQLYFI